MCNYAATVGRCYGSIGYQKTSHASLFPTNRKSYKEKNFYKIANHQSKLLDIIINIHILNHLYLENCFTDDSWGTINLSPSGLNKDSNYEIINFAPH